MADAGARLWRVLLYLSHTRHACASSEIAWFQSHVVRAPLARIMRLTDILKNAEGETYYSELLGHILTSAQELDDVIRSIVIRSAEVDNEPAAKIKKDLL